jgi:hypothetical protein
MAGPGRQQLQQREDNTGQVTCAIPWPPKFSEHFPQ